MSSRRKQRVCIRGRCDATRFEDAVDVVELKRVRPVGIEVSVQCRTG
jgi:hypothetical protein